MSAELFLLVNLLMNLSLLSVVSVHCGLFRPRRVLLAGSACTLYGLMEALHPGLLSAPPIQIGLLCAVSVAVTGKVGLRRSPAVALLLFCGASVAGGVGTMLGASGLPSGLRPLAASMGLIPLSLLLRVRRRHRSCWMIRVRISLGGQSTAFPALIDTGNRLTEPISGQPVMIAEAALLKPLLPDVRAFRVVGFGALGGNGSMKCFRPDAIWVEERGASRLMPDTWVAISPHRLAGAIRALAPCDYALILPGQ